MRSDVLEFLRTHRGSRHDAERGRCSRTLNVPSKCGTSSYAEAESRSVPHTAREPCAGRCSDGRKCPRILCGIFGEPITVRSGAQDDTTARCIRLPLAGFRLSDIRCELTLHCSLRVYTGVPCGEPSCHREVVFRAWDGSGHVMVAMNVKAPVT